MLSGSEKSGFETTLVAIPLYNDIEYIQRKFTIIFCHECAFYHLSYHQYSVNVLTIVNKINVQFIKITVVKVAENLTYEFVKIRSLPQLV